LASTKPSKHTDEPVTAAEQAAAEPESGEGKPADAHEQVTGNTPETAASEPATDEPSPNHVEETETVETAGEPTSATETPTEPQPLSPEEENEQLKARIEELTNLHLRAVADLDNYRKRARRELVEALRYACADLMTDLLPILDNFERALETDADTETAGLRQGVELILKQLLDTLAKHGLSPIPALHEPFDPSRHEALGQVETDETEPGLVAQEVRRGYQLHDRVLRASQVFVAAAPSTGKEGERESTETESAPPEKGSTAEAPEPPADDESGEISADTQPTQDVECDSAEEATTSAQE